MRLGLGLLIFAPAVALAQPAALSPAEKADFVARVQSCWNPPSGTDPTVTIGFSMDRDGRPDPDSFTLLGAADPQAFAAARRAVMLCAGAGYDLPKDRHDAWKRVELTFTANRTGDMP